mmetsp:Transcript_4419/g.7886  ORF Transcript_4419/g.7886 Transcript_4419/m.7886 type:complete len:96 (+) Transcript_4419:12-299(+)
MYLKIHLNFFPAKSPKPLPLLLTHPTLGPNRYSISRLLRLSQLTQDDWHTGGGDHSEFRNDHGDELCRHHIVFEVEVSQSASYASSLFLAPSCSP